MKPVEMQPQVFQQPNLTANAAQAATGSQAAQQAFAEQMRRTAEARPAQVQAPVAGDAARAAENPGEERGEKAARRPKRGAARQAQAPESGAAASPHEAGAALRGARVDIRV